MLRYFVPTVFQERSSRKNCEHQGTDNVQGQISKQIFTLNGGCCIYTSNLFLKHPQLWKLGNVSQIFPSFSKGISRHMTRLNQLHAKENIWWIISSTHLQFTTITNLFSKCSLSPFFNFVYSNNYRLKSTKMHVQWYMYNSLIQQ